MSSLKPLCSVKAVRNWLLLGIPIVFIIGGLTHFVFELSGENAIVGIFVPVNESVWEHLKMSFWPLLLWWIFGYTVLSRRCYISAVKWFAACAAALYVSTIFIISFFYTYTGALGVEPLLLVDIFSFLLGIIIAQISAYHIYKYANPEESCLIYYVFMIVLLAAAFIVFTFLPPHLPLFMDSNTGTYGI